MGRLIRFAVFALACWAIWHWAAAEWQRFTFGDQLQQVAQFGADRDEESVRAAVMAAADSVGVPLKPERLQVVKQGDRVRIDLSYTVQIEVFPRYYYPWTYDVSAQGWFIPGSRLPSR
jgi:hypothetical protein